MAAPATTARVDPVGIRLDDGYQTLLAFEADPDISMWEKTVQPPGMDGGDEIDTTTMHNSTFRTRAARALITLTESSTTVAYDPDLFNQIINIINVSASITVHFPDGSTLDFYGFLRTFEPQDHEEGAQPEAVINITPTNCDPSNNVEEPPVLTSVTGT